MTTELLIDLNLAGLSRVKRASFLNRLFVDTLTLKANFEDPSPTRRLPSNLKRLQVLLNMIADERVRTSEGNKETSFPPLVENHTGAKYFSNQGYDKGSIFALGVSTLIFFQIKECQKDRYFCQRGNIKVGEDGEYFTELDDNSEVLIYKVRFDGLVFRNIEDFKRNLNTRVKELERKRHKILPVIFQELLTQITSKYI